MLCLIDGYNLLYAMGVLRGRAGPTGLLKARLALLGLLHAVYDDEGSSVTVVFDAAHAPPDVADEEDYHGIHVRFAVHEDQADDLIESLIRHDSAPKRLTVVSDDHRIQQAAHRRDCIVMGCAEYLEWLDRRRRKRRQPAADAPVKPQTLSQEETQRWLQEFSDLENDPNLRALSDPPEWTDADR